MENEVAKVERVKLDRKTFQQEFHALTKEREDILAKSAPLRKARDDHANEARAKELEMNKEIKKVEEKLVEIDNNRGMLSRALGGVTGEAP